MEIDTFPSDNYESVKDILITQIEKIASILQLKDGIFHLQYIMDGKEPQIIEVMRRILGNMYSVPGNMLNGIDWDYWEVRARCGLTCKDFPQHINQEGFYAYKTILANQNGTIRSVNIPRQYQKYMVGKCILKKQGELIDNYKSQPIGFLFFQFSSMKEMKHILIESYRNDMVEMESVE